MLKIATSMSPHCESLTTTSRRFISPSASGVYQRSSGSRGLLVQYLGCIVEGTQQRVQIFSDLTCDWKPPKELSGSIYLDFNLPRISNVVPKRLHLLIQLFSVWLKTNNQLAEYSQNDRFVVRMETSVEARALFYVICLILGSRTGRRPTGSCPQSQRFTRVRRH